MTPTGSCCLCLGSLSWFADGTLLDRIPVSYLTCEVCGSVMLPDPTWLEEAYSSAISPLDVGLLERCVQLANVTTSVILAQGLRRGNFLDFGGGYGTFTRLMRDRGFDFRHNDPMCENIFAKGFEAELTQRQDLVTAFEVLEHLSDPFRELSQVAQSTDFLLVTTQLLPTPAPAPDAWDYYAPESGQHITFYTVAGLRALAERLGMQLTTSRRATHLFHRKPLTAAARVVMSDDRVAYALGALASEVGRRRGRTISDRDAAVARLRAGRGHGGTLS